MTSPLEQKVAQQIRAVVIKLTELGIGIDQELPKISINSRGNRRVSTPGPLTDLLKAKSYPELYALSVEARAFTMMMPDRALICFDYEIRRRVILKHRLAFLPHPDLGSLQNDPDAFLDDRQALLANWLEDHIVPTPLRMDYDKSAASADHPASHLTIGQFTNCRIPISAPVSPWEFVRFIVRAFYNTPDHKFDVNLPRPSPLFTEACTNEDAAETHLRTPSLP